ncbi:DEAD/DEAH box helicase [Methanothermococcus sp. SCGC AD-155-E23]|nr:DEAD/DEAH box helicase [Methanothermococcus sp. SCGC AD-155-E23]
MLERILEILRENGIKELRPPQKRVLERGLLDKGKNFLISIPTASGKTLIGEIALLNHLLEDRSKKGLFIVPLKALASEKYEEFRRKYERYGIKVALSIGDYDEEEDLEDYNIIITTAEKLDSLIRHRVRWIEDVSVAIIDEIHLIGNEERGGTLEVLITKLKSKYNVQIIGLSATIGNPEELAQWLDAELVIDNWRPVKLKKGIGYRDKILFVGEDGEVVEEYPLKTYNSRSELFNLVIDCVLDGGSLLIFCNSKRKAVEEAEKLDLRDYLSREELRELRRIKEEILSVFDRPTETCKTLAECIERGVAFHHAGLTYEQRRIVEEAFRRRIIKVICCTPTLSMGVNVPCRRAIVKDLKRFSKGSRVFIPKMEILQCIGRAGRPNLDPYGEGIIYVDEKVSAEEVKDYLVGPVEPISSGLYNPRTLRSHILGLIALGDVKDRESLRNFIENTFYAYQYGNISKILEYIEEVIRFLEFSGFISVEGGEGKYGVKILTLDGDGISIRGGEERYRITPLGRRVSELYIDPFSGRVIIEGLKRLNKMLRKKYLGNRDPLDCATFYILYLISKTSEMLPLLWIKSYKKDKKNKEEFLTYEALRRGIFIENKRDLKYIRSAMIFYDWIREVPEDKIEERYGIEPGILRYWVEQAKWLLHATGELYKILKIENEIISQVLEELKIRIEYGAGRELIDLLKIKYIGRARARMLYNAGIRSAQDIIDNYDKVRRILGDKIARKILKELKDSEDISLKLWE